MDSHFSHLLGLIIYFSQTNVVRALSDFLFSQTSMVRELSIFHAGAVRRDCYVFLYNVLATAVRHVRSFSVFRSHLSCLYLRICFSVAVIRHSFEPVS